jgi:hypothetical protein
LESGGGCFFFVVVVTGLILSGGFPQVPGDYLRVRL